MRVTALRRYPVKSMLGEDLSSARVEHRGLAGDRIYALIDDETQKVVSVKRPKRWGTIFQLSARTDGDAVRVRFPNGEEFLITDPELAARLSSYFNRAVSIATAPPPDATFDEAWVRNLKDGAGTYFDRPTRIEDGDELVNAGMLMSKQQSFFNLRPLHIVTTSATDALTAAAPGSRFDPHRFRPNIVIDGGELGFADVDWPGHTLTIGRVRLQVLMTVPRCVMTTLEQGDLPADDDVLRTITRLNAVDTLGTGVPYPCLGVYADVIEPGEIAVGNEVTLG